MDEQKKETETTEKKEINFDDLLIRALNRPQFGEDERPIIININLFRR